MDIGLEKIKNLTETLSRVEKNLHEEHNILKNIIEFSTDGYWDLSMVTNFLYLSNKSRVKLGLDKFNNTIQEVYNLLDRKGIEIFKLELHEMMICSKDSFRITVKVKKYNLYIHINGKVLQRNKINKPTRIGGSFIIIED